MFRWAGLVVSTLFWATCAYSESLLTLDRALRAENIQVQRANQNVLVSQARRDQAASGFGPQVRFNVSGSRTERRQSGFKQRFLGEDYSITLSQPVFDRPRFLEPDRLDALTERSMAGELRTLQERRLSLLQSFAEWVEALEHLRLLDERFQNLVQRREQVAQLFNSQRVSVTELLTVENELERVRVELVTTQATLARTESLIDSLIGSSVQLDWTPRPMTDVWDFDDLKSPPEPQQIYPALVEARANVEASRIAVNQAIGTVLPTVNAELAVRHTNIGANDTETELVDTYTARLTMSWALYDSGDREARIREATLILRDSELALMELERDLQRQQRTLEVEMQRAEAAWRAAKAERDSARKLVEAANRSFEVGVGDLGDSLVALDRLIDAKMRVSSTWLSGFLAAARIAENANQLDEGMMLVLSDLFSQ